MDHLIGTTEAASKFGRLVVRRKWAEILPLFTSALRRQHTPQTLEAEFGWKHLGPRLRQMFLAMTEAPEDQVPEIDPPKRFEVFEVEEREASNGYDANRPMTWIEVDFQPSEDSEFDECYNCFLAFVEEDGPKIAAYEIESATE